MIHIKNRKTGKVLHRVDANTLIGADLNYADLNNANLHRVDLRGAFLNNAFLVDADLSGSFIIEADLSHASLAHADLTGADLANANLSYANLTDADLTFADLTNAKLAFTDLARTDLREALLTGADFTGAYLSETMLVDCPTLHEAKGLEAVSHQASSILDTRTLRASVRHLPDVFLQGVGFTNREIEYLREIYAQGIQYYSCFLSHAGTDGEFADRLRKDFLDNEVSCWHYRHDMRGGKFYRPQISEAIRFNDKLVLICTEQSIKNDNVAGEVIEAMNREREAKSRKLFPVMLDTFIVSQEAKDLADAKMVSQEWPEDWVRYVQQYHISDFSQWKNHDAYTVTFKELLRDLKNPQPRS